MADKMVRIHTQKSNREKQRNPSERKVVFKAVLDNPFRVQWPSIPLSLQNSILAHVLLLFEGVSNYHRAQCRESRKRKRSNRNSDRVGKKSKSEQAIVVEINDRMKDVPSNTIAQPSKPNAESHEPADFDITTPRPPILDHIVYGINEVTKRLENQARDVRRSVILSTSPPVSQPPLSFIFVCRADVDHPLLIEHLPHLVAVCNSVQAKDFVKLIALPKESESKLAQSLRIRRAAVVGIDQQHPAISDLISKSESVPFLTAPWLTFQSTIVPKFMPTHVKHLRTTAPRDMKIAKEIRLREKHAAKESRNATGKGGQQS